MPTPETAPSRRRLDVATRRAGILAAARRVLAATDPASVTMADVAREAGVSEALVHHYFGNRAGLHLAIAEEWEASLAARQHDADRRLHPGSKARQRLLATLEVYLDVIAEDPQAWAWPIRTPESGPVEALAVRLRTRARHRHMLDDLLDVGDGPAEYAVEGFLGFVDAACLAWVASGCPQTHRADLTEAAVNALEAALVRVGRPAALQRLRE